MKFRTKLWKFLKSKKAIIGIIIIVALIAFFALKGKGEGEELYTLTSDNLAATGVMVAGTVVAQEEVDLSFETSGRISSAPHRAGDRVSQGTTIATLDMSAMSANLNKAQADLDAEIAKLNEYQTQEGAGLTEVETRKTQLARELQNAYAVAEDAIKNKNDQFFEDAQSRFPKILRLFDGYELQKQVDEERYQIGLVLKEWQTWSVTTSKNNYEDRIDKTKTNIERVQEYLNFISPIVSRFEATDRHPQTVIDKYKTDITTARDNMNRVLEAIIDAEESLRSTSSQIPYQEARVKSARAVVQNYQAEIAKGVIRAPFNGLVTKQDAKVGMSAMSDQALVSMISDSNYGIDTYVPEVYIAQIKVGNKARVILSSYGATEEFSATVSHVDPAASLRDGVATYKVELVFDANDERIKSGMTADVEIATETVNPSFWVPATAVIDQGGATYVKVRNGETTELRRIEPGERTAEEVEVKSGLIVGDQLIKNAQAK